MFLRHNGYDMLRRKPLTLRSTLNESSTILNPHCRIGRVKLKNHLGTEIVRFPATNANEVAVDLLEQARVSVDADGSEMMGYVIMTWQKDMRDSIRMAYWNNDPEFPTTLLPSLLKKKFAHVIASSYQQDE